MFGLPQRTEINKPLHKTKVFEKFDLTASQRDSFDADISRMFITHVVAESTIPTIKAGNEIADFYVIEVSLKRSEYAPKNIELLAKFIPRKILFVLHFEEKAQFAIHHTKLICSEWQQRDTLNVPLAGLDLDAVWENIVATIGSITVQEGNTLTEQIKSDEQKSILQKQIQLLQQKLNKEKQYNRQIEINAEIKRLKKQLNDIK
ncbi:MAG: DUF4391 domain-containing protein [Bacteroidaceae bacterium]|nr:DUF4391 domain-containing protein [Bacteroidaceae bacterium]